MTITAAATTVSVSVSVSGLKWAPTTVICQLEMTPVTCKLRSATVVMSTCPLTRRPFCSKVQMPTRVGPRHWLRTRIPKTRTRTRARTTRSSNSSCSSNYSSSKRSSNSLFSPVRLRFLPSTHIHVPILVLQKSKTMKVYCIHILARTRI